MNRTPPSLGAGGWLGMTLVLILAVGVRGGYVFETMRDASDAPKDAVLPRAAWQVQGIDLAAEAVIEQIRATGMFSAAAPFSSGIERTAHVSPGFPWLIAWLSAAGADVALVWPWINAVLGTLTVLCVMLFTCRVFDSTAAALAAGVLAAIYPYWIINTAEATDGVLATFLVALMLALGARAAGVGGYVVSLAFGLTLAALCLVRAELLPLALACLLWFVFRCRWLAQGWLFALLAVLGFGNGLGPWTVRNYQVFGELVPLVDSSYWHLYLGNCDGSSGGPHLWPSDPLPEGTSDKLRSMDNQAERYAVLGRITYGWIAEHPGQALAVRLRSAFYFVIGDDRWSVVHKDARLPLTSPVLARVEPWIEPACLGALWLLLILAPLGWRISHGRAADYRLLTLAFVLIPLPYVLTHADTLVGPRLPWDTVLICFAGYAIAGWWRRA